MFKAGLNCHSVRVFAISYVALFSVVTQANGLSCKSIFSNESTSKILETSVVESNSFYKNSELVTNKLIDEGVLTELRTSNPAKDHIEFLAEQVPVIANKLLIRFIEVEPVFERKVHIPQGKKNAEKFLKSKDQLKRNFEESYKLLLEEANHRLESQTVTYEWYMNFFLKSMIFADVTLKIQESTNMKQFEFYKKQLDIVLGNSKLFSSENLSELRLYSALGKEFSSLTKDAYFTRSLLEDTLVPVLFIPRDADIIRAERSGIHFVTLNMSRKTTLEGPKYPLQFASKQIEQRTKHLALFKDLIDNSKSKWIKNHDKIAAQVKNHPNLEALYAFILRDAGLQSELNKRFDQGFKIVFAFDAHKASDYLKSYFDSHQVEVGKVATRETQETLLKIIYNIEKDAIHYK